MPGTDALGSGRVRVERGRQTVTLALAQWAHSNTAILTIAEADNLVTRILDAIAQQPKPEPPWLAAIPIQQPKSGELPDIL